MRLATAERATAPEIELPAFFRNAIARGTRTESGMPGPAYWQNRIRYRIEAELEPESALLRGTEQIVFWNHSPEVLPSVVLELSQNIFAPGVPRNRFVPITGGITLERVAAEGIELSAQSANRIPIGGDVPGAPAGYAVQGTLGRIRLPTPLLPGDSVLIEIDWHLPIPPAPNFRTGWDEIEGMRAFQIAQWYPRLAIFDDLHGWNLAPYLGDGEFHQEFADFEVRLTLPAGMPVGATGTLINPEEVLTPEARARLAAAEHLGSITRILTAADRTAENLTLATPGDQLTWHFRADQVRDFAFATSAHYLWDAIPMRTGDGRTILVHALYRPGAAHWEEAARFGQHAIAFFDRALLPYPAPQLTITEGPIGGMEYPMTLFIGRTPSPEALYDVIAHEAAHQWFPMLVGQDEAAYAWMDEGLASFMEQRAAADFHGAEPFLGDLAVYRSIAGSEFEVPLMRHTDLVTPYGSRGVAAYSKPALLLRSLELLLGEDHFQRALSEYAQAWSRKHPTPWDFFQSFQRAAGTDLGWFFHPWWFGTGTLDQAIARVEPDGADGVHITIADLGSIRMPTFLVATTASGRRLERTIPLEEWFADPDRTRTLHLQSEEAIVEIVLDPDGIFPDLDPANNRWRASD